MQNKTMYLFPFGKIPGNSTIVIYGYGKVGQSYLQQVLQTEYCKVEAVIDQDYTVYDKTKFCVPLCGLTSLQNLQYDYLVIAIFAERICKKVYHELVTRYEVPEGKIICADNSKFQPTYLVKANSACYNLSYRGQPVSVLVFLSVGLGDCILAKRFLREIAVIVGKCGHFIDICTSARYLSYVRSIFSNTSFIGEIIENPLVYQKEKMNYTLSMRIGYFIEIDHFAKGITVELYESFVNAIRCLQQRCIAYGLHLDHPMDNAVHFARCRLNGVNCYTAYNYGDVFHIQDYHVEIPMEKDYEIVFHQLHLKKYITLNLGWKGGGDVTANYPDKAWPLAHYNRLIELLKTKYPQIEIMQLGLAGSVKMQGADHYLFGKSLELIKYVLKNAILHIDCESGFVHLATQLGTKCVVLFGPTPVDYFGYAENINIVSPVCSGCCYLEKSCSACARGQAQPECMMAIMPEMVMKRVNEVIEVMTNNKIAF